jgi:hypothetical protein
MRQLTLKIKSYHEDESYLTLNIYKDLSNDQLKKLALDCKAVVDDITNPMSGTPNIMRFEDFAGVYDYEMNQLVAYRLP